MIIFFDEIRFLVFFFLDVSNDLFFRSMVIGIIKVSGKTISYWLEIFYVYLKKYSFYLVI